MPEEIANADQNYEAPQYATNENYDETQYAHTGDENNYAYEEPQPQYQEDYNNVHEQPITDPNLYYDGQLQPGEQYYASDANVESQPLDQFYYNEYDPSEIQPAADKFSSNSDIEVQPQFEMQNPTNINVPPNSSDQVQTTDYLVSDSQGNPDPMVGDQSESDFDFSTSK